MALKKTDKKPIVIDPSRSSHSGAGELDRKRTTPRCLTGATKDIRGMLGKKCCGVYPAFFTEQTFDSKGYYVCLVCGKESKHEVMPWIAAREWNRGNFIFDPQAENYQMTIFDILGGG